MGWMTGALTRNTDPGSGTVGGAIWINTDDGRINIRDNSGNWVPSAPRIAWGESPPANPAFGDFWFDSNNWMLRYRLTTTWPALAQNMFFDVAPQGLRFSAFDPANNTWTENIRLRDHGRILSGAWPTLNDRRPGDIWFFDSETPIMVGPETGRLHIGLGNTFATQPGGRLMIEWLNPSNNQWIGPHYLDSLRGQIGGGSPAAGHVGERFYQAVTRSPPVTETVNFPLTDGWWLVQPIVHRGSAEPTGPVSITVALAGSVFGQTAFTIAPGQNQQRWWSGAVEVMSVTGGGGINYLIDAVGGGNFGSSAFGFHISATRVR